MACFDGMVLLSAIGLWTLFASAQIPTTIPEGPLFYGANIFRKCIYETQPVKDALIKSVIRINEHFLAKKGSDEPFKQIAKIIKITRREMVIIIADTKCNLSDVNLADSFFDSTYIEKCPIPLEDEDETKVWKCSVRKIPTTNGEIIVGYKCGAARFGQVKGINLDPQTDTLNETRTGYKSLINCLYLKPAASQALLEGLRLVNFDDATSEQNVFQQVAAPLEVSLLDEEENKWLVIMTTMDTRRTKDEETRKLLAKPRLFSLFWDVDFAEVGDYILRWTFEITSQNDFDNTNSTLSRIEDVRSKKFTKDDLLKFIIDAFPSYDQAMRTDNPLADQ